ncbi:hypothetical protein, partial [Streptomyces sp. WM6386]|uniref:hypothetical protein n=1 Tax=Streptomyces sp. WM6386 TaxID=1415558 RepID=UPI000ADC9635
RQAQANHGRAVEGVVHRDHGRRWRLLLPLCPLAKLIVNGYNGGLTEQTELLIPPGRPDKD